MRDPAGARSAWYQPPAELGQGCLPHAGRCGCWADKAQRRGLSWATPGGDPRQLGRVWGAGSRERAGGRRGADLDGAGVLAVVQQPHGAAVLALQTPAAAAHQPAQHLPARSPVPGSDAAALRTPDPSPFSAAAPRRALAPVPSPWPDRRRCLLPPHSSSFSRATTASPRKPKQAGFSPGRPTARAQLMGRGLGRGPMEVSAAEPIGMKKTQSQ